MNLLPFFSGCFNRPAIQTDDNSESTKLPKEAVRMKIMNKHRKDKLLEMDKDKTESEFDEDSARTLNKCSNPKGRPSLEDDLYPQKWLGSTDGSVNDEDFEASEEYMKTKGISFKDWIKILKNNDVDNTSHLELAESLRFGIPDELRPQIWAFLTKLDKLKKQHAPALYTKLKTFPSVNDDQIQKDIGRTFNDHPFFVAEKGQQILFNILRAYTNYDNEVGYTQGMNFIVGTLLIILDPKNYKDCNQGYFKDYEDKYEEEVFWLFIHISFEKNYRFIFKKDFPKLVGMIRNLENRIRVKLPEVYEHIIANGLEIFLCFHQLFLSMLLVHSPIPISKRIFDLFLIEEENLLFKVLIRAISVCKREILELKDEKLRNFFDQQMMQVCYEKYKSRLYLLFPSPESLD